jgi:hypothetical protein
MFGKLSKPRPDETIVFGLWLIAMRGSPKAHKLATPPKRQPKVFDRE